MSRPALRARALLLGGPPAARWPAALSRASAPHASQRSGLAALSRAGAPHASQRSGLAAPARPPAARRAPPPPPPAPSGAPAGRRNYRRLAFTDTPPEDMSAHDEEWFDRNGQRRRVRDEMIPLRPTIDQARRMPRFIYEYSNEMLFYAARDMTAHDVHQERLIREIMVVDNIGYDEAAEEMRLMFRHNSEQSWYLMVPFHAGLGICVISALCSVPFVFNPTAATGFAALIGATPEEPLAAGVGMANVGSWSWPWMEPLIGTASFAILCLQLLRALMLNLAYRPYLDSVQSYRANSLADAFPQYDRPIVKDFGRSQPLRRLELGPGFRSYLKRKEDRKKREAGEAAAPPPPPPGAPPPKLDESPPAR
ncbi:hypothetical protein M885DRAFT_531404 [Pelagophyceae sp. CCMP2097]|nr:hypothetical protein M885DRAFT_531404 [Pelagophyceae sp. CCMP2097]